MCSHSFFARFLFSSGCFLQSGLFFSLVLLFVLFAIRGLCADFRVIFFQSRQIFSRFGELAFLHAFADVRMNERPLGTHKVELMVELSLNSTRHYTTPGWTRVGPVV